MRREWSLFYGTCFRVNSSRLLSFSVLLAITLFLHQNYSYNHALKVTKDRQTEEIVYHQYKESEEYQVDRAEIISY